jgi:hypothetical protein
VNRWRLGWLLALALPLAAGADDADDWDDWDDDGALISGHVELGHGVRRRSEPLFDGAPTRSELQAQIEASREFDRVVLRGKLDLTLDRVEDRARFDLRHATVELPIGRRGHLTLGRQVLTWGLGDLLFINDRFPKDYVQPLVGADDAYFKAPSNSLRWSAGFDPFNLDLAYTPVFTPDRYIDGERLGFHDPETDQRVGGQRLIDAQRPPRRLANGELALRLHRTHGGIEYAVYGYRGFDKQPLARDPDGRPTFLRRDSAGASLRAPWAGGIVSIEAGREWPQADPPPPADRRPAQTSWLLGYERELRPRLTAGLQLFEQRSDTDRDGVRLATRRQASLRLTWQALRDRLRISVIGLHSPSQHDHWLRATASYRFNDRWLAGLTANEFGGPAASPFGQLEPDSNLGLWLRRQF